MESSLLVRTCDLNNENDVSVVWSAR